MRKSLFVMLLIVQSVVWANAQIDQPAPSSARANVLLHYNQYFSNQSRLYNGTEYKEPVQTNDTHPFYKTDNWQKTDIRYDGLVFTGIDVLCDLFGDNLVIEYFNGNKVGLISQKLESFTIGGHRFLNIPPGMPLNGLPEGGFYELIYDGDMQCLARRKKTIQRNVESGAVQIYYKERVSYFVRKESIYHPVKSKRTLLTLLEDQKSEVNFYIKRESISFRNRREQAFVKILSYYQSLKN